MINKKHFDKNKYTRPGLAMTPKMIVVHYFGLHTGSAESLYKYWGRSNNLVHASSHYAVDGEQIIEMVPPDEVCYHVAKYGDYYTPFAKNIFSDESVYNYAIGIECAHKESGEFTTHTKNNLKCLIDKLFERFGKLMIVRHFDITGKECPYYYVKKPFGWLKLWEYLNN